MPVRGSGNTRSAPDFLQSGHLGPPHNMWISYVRQYPDQEQLERVVLVPARLKWRRPGHVALWWDVNSCDALPTASQVAQFQEPASDPSEPEYVFEDGVTPPHSAPNCCGIIYGIGAGRQGSFPVPSLHDDLDGPN